MPPAPSQKEERRRSQLGGLGVEAPVGLGLCRECDDSDPGLQKLRLDLEMVPKDSAELLATVDEEWEMSTNATRSVQVDNLDIETNSIKEEKASPVSTAASASNLDSGSNLVKREETVSKREDLVAHVSPSEANKERKSSSRLMNSSGKRKVKVDWTPELHRQFVQAVEQLGVDKAVPSKILQVMGIDCLTRHNVASHLQKYRSHRKHLLAREAEAVTWSWRRQIYGTSDRTVKSNMNSWVVPTTGFPQAASMHHLRPLHVWGHPSADQSVVYMWPSNLPSSPSPTLPGDTSFWYCHPQDVPTTGMSCLQPQIPSTCFNTSPVPGLPPISMYRLAPSIGIPVVPNRQTLEPPLDSHPSKERIEEVIGDVLSKPWLPLPLGLKPPSIDSVMVELQHQGISKIPPSCA